MSQELPKEIIDIISIYGGHRMAICIENEYAKQIVLRKLQCPKIWKSQDEVIEKWLMKYEISGYDEGTLYNVLEKENLQVAKWLLSQKMYTFPLYIRTFNFAFHGRGHMNIIKFLHENTTDVWDNTIMDQVAYI